MDIFSIILISIGLAMDCFAISISKGICVQRFYFFGALRMAFLFGLFQGIMPLIGFYASSYFAEQIKLIAHWIAFFLLGFIGVKMIIDAFKTNENISEETNSIKKHFKWKSLLLLAIATSIDALATGVVFTSFPEVIWITAGLIAVASFLFSFAGLLL